MSDEECNCSYHNDICSSCRKAEEEVHKELASLRAWKEKARPFLEHHLKEYHQNYYDEAVELSGANSIQATTIKKCMDTLTELLKEGE